MSLVANQACIHLGSPIFLQTRTPDTQKSGSPPKLGGSPNLDGPTPTMVGPGSLKSSLTRYNTWLPAGYSQIFRLSAFSPSGLKDWLYYALLQNLIPSFPWIAPPALHPGAIQGKGGIKFCHLANLVSQVNNAEECRTLCRRAKGTVDGRYANFFTYMRDTKDCSCKNQKGDARAAGLVVNGPFEDANAISGTGLNNDRMI